MTITESVIPFCTVLTFCFLPFSLTAQATEEANWQITEPMKLVEESGVAFKETNRTFSTEKFYGLKKRYSRLEGIVMIGLTNEQGEVLLRGPENWAPPGGAVQQGEEWIAAAKSIMERQTGISTRINEPVLVEQMHFYLKGNKDDQFTGTILHLQASAIKAADSPNQLLPANSSFKWFDKVPENAHPNHIDHIELYLNH